MKQKLVLECRSLVHTWKLLTDHQVLYHRRYNVLRKSFTSCRNKTFNKQIECLKILVWKIVWKSARTPPRRFPTLPATFCGHININEPLKRWKKLGCSIISHGQSEILKRRGTFHLKIVRANLHVDVAIVVETIGKNRKTYFRFYNMDFFPENF